MNKRLFLKMSLDVANFSLVFTTSFGGRKHPFSSCKEAWANGYSDIHEGEPGYSAKLDRDHDGGLAN